MCHMSCVTCKLLVSEVSRWRVCYQRGLPRLVSNESIILSTVSNLYLKDHIVIFENKGHIGEVVGALFISTKPPMICGVPRWVASEAGLAGGVEEQEWPGLLGQQARGVEPHPCWPGRLGQQGRNFNRRPYVYHVFNTCHDPKEYCVIDLIFLTSESGPHPCWWRVCYQRGLPRLVFTSW